jgi:hypothetical protein
VGRLVHRAPEPDAVHCSTTPSKRAAVDRGDEAVYAIVGSSESIGVVPPGVAAVTAIAYVLPAVWLVTLVLGSGRTPYDRIAGAVVARSVPRA